MADVYSFPQLDYVDLSTCLSELGAPLSVAQLKEPKDDEMKPVFDHLLEQLKGVDREELRQMDFRGIELLPYPELHEESLVDLGTMSELLDLCQKAGVHDITQSDFVQPEKGRIRLILSALINFAKLREDKLDHFGQFTLQMEELAQQLAEFESLATDLESQCAQLASTHDATIATELQQLQQEVTEKKALVHARVAEQGEIRDALKAEKATSTELAAAIEARSNEIATVQAESKRVASQILPEPDKLHAALKDRTNQTHRGRAAIQAQTAALKAAQAHDAQHARVEERVSKRLELLQSFATEQAALVRLHKQLSEQAALEADRAQGVDEYASQESSLKENISRAQERLFSLQRGFESKRVTATAALEQVTAECAALEADMSHARTNADSNEALVSNKKSQLAHIQQEHARTTASLRSKYATLAKAVADYHDRLAAVMGDDA